jgi:hypothetical protein
MMNWGGVNDAVLAEFGEILIFSTAGGSKSLTAIVLRPRAPVSSMPAAQNALVAQVLGPNDLLVSAKTSAIAACGIEVQNTTTIDGVSYWVSQLWPDDGGMTAMELRP